MQSLAKNSDIANGSPLDMEKEFIPNYMEIDVALPGVMTCRLNAPLYYGNAEYVMNEMLSIVRTSSPRIRWFILRFDSLGDVDYIAAKRIMELADRMGREQVALVFVGLSTDLKHFLADCGVFGVVAPDNVFTSLDAALTALKHCATDDERGRKMS
ncbi:MAG TPA: sodium-independent anion transporter [Methylomirabilota bacterium]|nr:sodium-independent anion transporter [Methylomirabilota bacterium]